MEILLEPQDVARALGGIGPGSVRRYCTDGLLPVAARTPRGVRLFRPADVERFKKTRQRNRARVPIATRQGGAQ